VISVYTKRLADVLVSRLSERSRFKAINMCAVAVLTYYTFRVI